MSSERHHYRIGVDVGGTFTDCVLLRPDGSILLEKTPTTPEDQSDGVLAGIARLAEAENLADVTALLSQSASIVAASSSLRFSCHGRLCDTDFGSVSIPITPWP